MKCTLRPFGADDAGALYALTREASVRRRLPQMVMENEAHAHFFIEQCAYAIENLPPHEGAHVFAAASAEGALIGLAGLMPGEDGGAELGYLISEKYRRQGFGQQAMAQWEARMKGQGCAQVLISTQVDEDAQHFYRKIGYKDIGGIILDFPGYEQPMEMFMAKLL